jgi:hypothetical protein
MAVRSAAVLVRLLAIGDVIRAPRRDTPLIFAGEIGGALFDVEPDSALPAYPHPAHPISFAGACDCVGQDLVLGLVTLTRVIRARVTVVGDVAEIRHHLEIPLR